MSFTPSQMVTFGCDFFFEHSNQYVKITGNNVRVNQIIQLLLKKNLLSAK